MVRTMQEMVKEVIYGNRFGLQAVATAADLLAAEVRFDIWCQENLKTREKEGKLIEALDLHEELRARCENFVAELMNGGDASIFILESEKIIGEIQSFVDRV